MPPYKKSAAGWIDAPGDEIIPIVIPSTLSDGGCRAVRCTTVGTLIGVTIAGNSRTVTFYAQGEILPVGFISVSGGTGAFEAIY